jgi:hypothetical protein
MVADVIGVRRRSASLFTPPPAQIFFLRPIVAGGMAESAEFRERARTPATAGGRLHLWDHVLAAA